MYMCAHTVHIVKLQLYIRMCTCVCIQSYYSCIYTTYISAYVRSVCTYNHATAVYVHTLATSQRWQQVSPRCVHLVWLSGYCAGPDSLSHQPGTGSWRKWEWEGKREWKHGQIPNGVTTSTSMYIGTHCLLHSGEYWRELHIRSETILKNQKGGFNIGNLRTIRTIILCYFSS